MKKGLENLSPGFNAEALVGALRQNPALFLTILIGGGAMAMWAVNGLGNLLEMSAQPSYDDAEAKDQPIGKNLKGENMYTCACGVDRCLCVNLTRVAGTQCASCATGQHITAF